MNSANECRVGIEIYEFSLDPTDQNVNISLILKFAPEVIFSRGRKIYHRRVNRREAGIVASIQIPWQSLSPAALNGVIEEFVSREGTEYGAQEVSLETKCRQVMRQLEKGDVIITFNDEAQSCSIVSSREL